MGGFFFLEGRINQIKQAEPFNYPILSAGCAAAGHSACGGSACGAAAAGGTPRAGLIPGGAAWGAGGVCGAAGGGGAAAGSRFGCEGTYINKHASQLQYLSRRGCLGP